MAKKVSHTYTYLYNTLDTNLKEKKLNDKEYNVVVETLEEEIKRLDKKYKVTVDISSKRTELSVRISTSNEIQNADALEGIIAETFNERKVPKIRLGVLSNDVELYPFSYEINKGVGKQGNYSFVYTLVMKEGKKQVYRKLDDFEFQVIHEDIFDILNENRPEYVNSMEVEGKEQDDSYTFTVSGTYNTSEGSLEKLKKYFSNTETTAMEGGVEFSLKLRDKEEKKGGKEEKKEVSKKGHKGGKEDKTSNKKDDKKKGGKDSLPKVNRGTYLIPQYIYGMGFGVYKEVNGKKVVLKKLTEKEEKAISEFLSETRDREYDADQAHIEDDFEDGVLKIQGRLQLEIFGDEEEIEHEIQKRVERIMVGWSIKVGKDTLYLF